MALRGVYLGNIGPFMFDDTEYYPGTTEPNRAIFCPDGTIRAKKVVSDETPTNASDVIRLADVGAGGGMLNPTITDVTSSRNIGSTYQNTSGYWMLVIVSVELEN